MKDMVEINFNRASGFVCAGNLTKSEAKVICRLSGHRDGVGMPAGSFSDNSSLGYSRFLLDFLKCTGDEKRLLDCVVSLSSSQSFLFSDVSCQML